MNVRQFSRVRARPGLTVPLVVLLLLTAPIAPAHEDSVEHEIHELIDAFLQGASVNDIEVHDRFWAEDLVYTSSSGQRRGKPETMARLRQALPADPDELPRYRGEDLNIGVFGKLAVVTFRLVATMPDGATSEYYNTGVFRHERDRWRAFTWQATRIPEPE